MKLLDDLYLVASGDVGLSLSSYLDCNVYLIDTGEGAILIDAGSNDAPALMDANIKAAGFCPQDIKIVLLTHYHADHSAGAARLRALTGAAIYAPEKEAPAIQAGDAAALGLVPAQQAGYVYPPGYGYEACPDVIPLAPGHKITLGRITLTPYEVPGHSRQSMVFHSHINAKSCLFTGDALFPTGQILLQNLPDVSVYDYGQALKRLCDLPFDVFLPGHREPSMARGNRHLLAAVQKFDQLLIPPQLV